MSGRTFGLVRVVAEGRRDDGARPRQECLRVAGDLRLRHREAHAGEEATRAALADVVLCFLVRLGRRRADDVDPELAGDALELPLRHEGDRSTENHDVRH